MGKKTPKRKGAPPKPYQAMTTVELRRATGDFERPDPPGPDETGPAKTLTQLLADERDLRKQIDTLMGRLAQVHTAIATAGAAAAEQAGRSTKRG